MLDSLQKERIARLLDEVGAANQRSFLEGFARHLEFSVGRYKHDAGSSDLYQALAYSLRDTLIERWNQTQERYRRARTKRVYYLSMEFLIGTLTNAILINLDMRSLARDAFRALGLDLDAILAYEPDAGLGNGGLGRLAACFLDSLATLGLPGVGMGLRYEYGMFHQQLIGGAQRETPDNWLARGNPWEIARNLRYTVQFGGSTEREPGPDPYVAARWTPAETVISTASDILVPGRGTDTVNHLRLWQARSSSEFNLDYFNHGDYLRAVEDLVHSEHITRVLYPGDESLEGRELRLKQEYFLVSSAVQDALRTLYEEGGHIRELPERVIFQMNDTHPAVAVAELMRLMLDVYGLPWSEAWELTVRSLAYTNHTVLPEALESWDVELFGRVLPRHLEIIYLINHRFLGELREHGFSEADVARLSIVQEGTPKRVRMAHLAVAGSAHVNGVAALHTEILKNELFRDFYRIWPHKFSNKTNGVTHRRWLLSANESLAELITKRIGPGWIRDFERIRELEAAAEDAQFLADWDAVRRKNKAALAQIIRFETGVAVDPDSLFDAQVKRIHEYKRQHLNLLRIIADYLELKADPARSYAPRTFLFAGKAAPGYRRAKLIIRLIHAVADAINADVDVAGRMRVVFLPDFRVSLAERIYPAADLSEQISTAGMEASGTGNMKFMMNGAITVGALDGANVEIASEVGAENIYIFGHTVEDLARLRASGYDPGRLARKDESIRSALDALRTNRFNSAEPGLFDEIVESLTSGGDPYFLLADLPLYRETQARITRDFADREAWLRRSVLNCARSAYFTADRTVRQYARDVWGLSPTAGASTVL